YPGQDTLTIFPYLISSAPTPAATLAPYTSLFRSPATPQTLALAPPTATKAAGTQQCVTATLTDAYANPNPNVAVVFAATGQNAAGPTTATTDASGQAQFCYTGTKAGQDTISAFADLNSNAAKDSGEPADTASVTFVNYARPRGASPFRVALVPAYRQCGSAGANDTHGAPLTNPSCKPATQASNFLTVGTPDVNG